MVARRRKPEKTEFISMTRTGVIRGDLLVLDKIFLVIRAIWAVHWILMKTAFSARASVMKQKTWLIPSFGKAPLMLTSADVINGDLQVVGCGIYVVDGNGEAMEAALSGLPRMAEPIRRSKSNDGAAVIWWRARVGESLPSEKSEVMLSSGVPGLPGATINLILKSKIDR